MTDDSVLDNPFWHALTTDHAGVAERKGLAVRYLPEVSVFAAVDSVTPDGWHDLAALVGPGTDVMIARRSSVELRSLVPDDWTVMFAGNGHQMILRETLNDVDRPAAMRILTEADNEAALALAKLAAPGPFRPRTTDLGGYRGIFDGDVLLAMAGQRLSTERYVEVSAVCTHPDARRRGYGAALSAAVADGIIAAGKTPILHVAESNAGARRIYEALGFRVRADLTFMAVRTP